ncbi:vacuolar protein sorting-associated protein 13 [Trichonephila inaurata madagascariensis]|uniref:Vacuolar protein sorting-associated protein 13 n=1 Tax=Trichonephila inaurata madagascariensis TaxID=2747483 RepID=A0A8X6X6F8_9ARAC|nr:vacuolar protein sorting-associated protein 13 [Trichonephila inaurata madagascariensis]
MENLVTTIVNNVQGNDQGQDFEDMSSCTGCTADVAYFLPWLCIFFKSFVSLQNVHIRYEDSVSTSGPLACGLVLQNLTAVTTNSKWKATQIDADARSLFKV